MKRLFLTLVRVIVTMVTVVGLLAAVSAESPLGRQWPEHTIADSGELWPVPSFAEDLDGDGDLDVVSSLIGGAPEDGLLVWYENSKGDGSAWTRHLVSDQPPTEWPVAGDVDGDGDLDIVSVPGGEKGAIVWYENTAGGGSVWNAHTVIEVVEGASDVAVADVDGDGDLDALSARKNEAIAWFENAAGDGTAWGAHEVAAATPGGLVHAADMNGDGSFDLLFCSMMAERVAWYENPAGDGTVWKERIVPTKAPPSSVSPVDLDGDGDLDILAEQFANDVVVWRENKTGKGSTWAKHTILKHRDGMASAFPADMDKDGDPDVLVSQAWDHTAAWHENSAGDGSKWTRRLIRHITNLRHVLVAADVDGDGDVDVLAAWLTLGGEGKLGWLENETARRDSSTKQGK